MARTETRVMTAHIPVPLVEKIDEFSLRLDRPRGWIIKQALSSWIEQEEEYYRLTCEALQDVKEGQTIGHRDVKNWIQNLKDRK